MVRSELYKTGSPVTIKLMTRQFPYSYHANEQASIECKSILRNRKPCNTVQRRKPDALHSSNVM